MYYDLPVSSIIPYSTCFNTDFQSAIILKKIVIVFNLLLRIAHFLQDSSTVNIIFMLNWGNIHNLLKMRLDLFWILEYIFGCMHLFSFYLFSKFASNFCPQNVMNGCRLVSKMCQSCAILTLSVSKKHQK